MSREYAKKFGVTVVLKSAATVITDGESLFLNTAGNAGMAKAGSGDVLGGIIAGLLLRGESAALSAACGCYLFGRAGELAVERKNQYSVTALDFSSCLSDVITAVTGG